MFQSLSVKLGLLCLVAFIATCMTVQHTELHIPDSNLSIIDGKVRIIPKTPFIVKILDKSGQVICTGSLVSSTHVVTAAQCLHQRKHTEVFVVGGTFRYSEVSDKRDIAKWFIPEDFNAETLNMDIAVIKLSKELTGDKIKTVPLCSKFMEKDASIIETGWGLSHKDEVYSEVYESVYYTVMTAAACNESYKNEPRKISDSMVCAYRHSTPNGCLSDLGGPGIRRNQLCGVFSWSIGCKRGEFPSVYTSVFFARDFIKNAMKS